ncbi:MAG: DUF2059 domain-containing protein [Rhodanobacter sp.]
MRASKWLWLVAAAALTLAGTVQSHPAKHHSTKHVRSHVTSGPPSVQQVLQLFQVIHVGDVLDQMNARMAQLMAQAVPCVPASYWQGFIDAESSKQVLERMVPAYQRHFTEGDVDGLVKFYRSPLGQKVLTEMPEAMAEAEKVGQQWGIGRRQEMLGALQRQGKLDGQGRCPAVPAVASSTQLLALPNGAGQPARAVSSGAPPVDRH